MKHSKLYLALLLVITLNSVSADLIVFPENKESEVIKSQPKIMIHEVEQSSLCKAAIISLMDYENRDITSKQINPVSAVVTRYRSEDRTKWNWLCKVDNNRIVYASMNIDGPQKIKIGRWRIHPDDEKITFNIDETQLVITITYSESDITRKSFSLKSVKNWK